MYRVLSCGNGGSYALGHGNRESFSSFRVIESLEGVKIRRIGAGMNHSGAISEEGKVYLWGITSDIAFSREFKEQSLLKRPTEIPFKSDDGKGDIKRRSTNSEVFIEDFSMGENFTVALSSKGAVYSWGCNEFGQLGLGHD